MDNVVPFGEEAIKLTLPLSVYREALAALEERVVLLHECAIENPMNQNYWRAKALFANRCVKVLRDAGR